MLFWEALIRLVSKLVVQHKIFFEESTVNDNTVCLILAVEAK